MGATRDLEKGELVLKVPKSALITRETLLLKDDHLSLAVNAHTSLSPIQVFPLFHSFAPFGVKYLELLSSQMTQLFVYAEVEFFHR